MFILGLETRHDHTVFLGYWQQNHHHWLERQPVFIKKCSSKSFHQKVPVFVTYNQVFYTGVLVDENLSISMLDYLWLSESSLSVTGRHC